MGSCRVGARREKGDVGVARRDELIEFRRAALLHHRDGTAELLRDVGDHALVGLARRLGAHDGRKGGDERLLCGRRSRRRRAPREVDETLLFAAARCEEREDEAKDSKKKRACAARAFCCRFCHFFRPLFSSLLASFFASREQVLCAAATKQTAKQPFAVFRISAHIFPPAGERLLPADVERLADLGREERVAPALAQGAEVAVRRVPRVARERELAAVGGQYGARAACSRAAARTAGDGRTSSHRPR